MNFPGQRQGPRPCRCPAENPLSADAIDCIWKSSSTYFFDDCDSGVKAKYNFPTLLPFTPHISLQSTQRRTKSLLRGLTGPPLPSNLSAGQLFLLARGILHAYYNSLLLALRSAKDTSSEKISLEETLAFTSLNSPCLF
jgi:hypothetical protein